MLERSAHAKINWTLDIAGTRDDGYHLMDMVMQSIALCDQMTFSLRHDGQVRLSIPGSALLPDQSNLVLRAAHALKNHTGCALGADITLIKQIPMGAGLGGGSADCACTLHALCDLWHLHLTDAEKAMIGLTLGADVPFCLYGHSARVQGIGEVITPIPMARTFHLVLIQPCQALSTREAFLCYDKNPAAVQHPCHEQALRAFAAGDTEGILQSCANVMQPSSEQLRPRMGQALADLQSAGAFWAQMTGSGSVVYGVFDTPEAADRAYDALQKRYDVCIRTRTLP